MHCVKSRIKYIGLNVHCTLEKVTEDRPRLMCPRETALCLL